MFARNPDNALVFGVCAGLADYLGVSVALVRIITLLSFLFTGSLTFWAYIIAAILLPKESK